MGQVTATAMRSGIAALMLLALSSACGGSSSKVADGASPQQSPNLGQLPTALPTTLPKALPTALPAATQAAPDSSPALHIIDVTDDRNLSFKLSREGGYTGSGYVGVGKPLKAQTGLAVRLRERVHALGSGCQFQPDVDAALPWYVTLTNMTATYDAQIAFNMDVEEPGYQGANAPAVESDFSSGSVCHSLSLGATEALTGGVTGKLPTNESNIFGGFIILHNFYSPDHPNGDRARLHATNLRIVGAADDTNNLWLLEGASGTNVMSVPLGYKMPLG